MKLAMVQKLIFTNINSARLSADLSGELQRTRFEVTNYCQKPRRERSSKIGSFHVSEFHEFAKTFMESIVVPLRAGMIRMDFPGCKCLIGQALGKPQAEDLSCQKPEFGPAIYIFTIVYRKMVNI